MERVLMVDIMNLQAAYMRRMISEMAKAGILEKADEATVNMLYEAVSKAYKEVAALDSRRM